MYPIHIGELEDFATARELLVRARFTESAIAEQLGVPILTQRTIDASRESAANKTDIPYLDILHLMTRLFVLNSYVDEGSIRESLSSIEIEALHRLGLVVREPDRSSWYAPVCLCPVGEVYTISDRWRGPDGKPIEGFEAFEDIVYPSVVPNTRLFLDLLPDSRCESFLDLCAGTGVAALIAASKYATEAYAYDIAPRSTHFAEFARILNGLSNLTTGTGDLYGPAGGATFDRIVAHPPYVPVLQSKWIFFGGGPDGEDVTRRIIEQAPRYLRPDGTLYCLAMASDRAEQPLEHRIREWLQPQQHEFDVAVVVRRTIEPREFAFDSLTRAAGDVAQARKWKELFESRHITSLPYAMIMVQRKAAGRQPFTARRQTGENTTLAEHQWLLEWETRAAANPEMVLEMPLRASPDCELRTLSRLNGDDWEAQEYNLASSHPFRMKMKIDPWIAYLLTRCDGTKTGTQLLEELKAEGAIHAGTLSKDFSQVLNTLVSGGFLLIH